MEHQPLIPTPNYPRTWREMSERRLHNYLTLTKQYPAPMVAQIMGEINEWKEYRRRERIKHGVASHYWDSLIDKAVAELKTLRVLKAQSKGAKIVDPEQKWQALDLYADVIRRTLTKLRRAKKDGRFTPKELTAQLAEEGIHIPNQGAHWTDWVSERGRVKVELAFGELPKGRGRYKVPFERG